jgi:hypothetical protein
MSSEYQGLEVDYSRRGQVLHLSEIPPQEILYSVVDILGQQVHYSRQADNYVKDFRRSKPWQRYALNYLDKIPTILKEPSIVIKDAEDFTQNTLIYYKEIYIREKRRNVLFALVVKIAEENVIYNFHPQESGKVKSYNRYPPPEVEPI